ncbi:MAG: glycosyltransferase [Mogibacterium sp.]|nr:glycosyltransferase [Mogibacterium sp.]
MNIAIVVLFMNSFGKKGFYQSQEFGMADAFAVKGYDVDVYRCITEQSYTEIRECRQGRSYGVYYNNVSRFGTHAIFDPESFFIKHYDAIIAFCDTQLIVPRLERYCQRHGTRFIPYVGVTESVAFSMTVKKHVMDAVFRNTTLKTYKRCDHIFCKNRDVMRSLVSFGVSEDRLIFSPVGINLRMLNSRFRYDDIPAARDELDFNGTDKVVLYVGRLNNEKRPLDMFRIIDRLNHGAASGETGYKLVMIGDGFLASEVERLAEERNHDCERVRYIKRVKYEEMWKYYAAADYFVNLWDREVFGMAIVEAIYYMTPSFLISAPGPEVIAEGMEYAHICASDEEIVSRIRECHADREGLERDREKLIKDLSWDRFVKNMEDTN